MKFTSTALGAFLASASFLPGSMAALESFQSGPHAAPLYAAGAGINPLTNEVFITGITYDLALGENAQTSNGAQSSSSCFVSSLRPGLDSSFFSTLNKATLAGFPVDDGADESCRGITALTQVDDGDILVVGNSDPGGLYYGETATTPQAGFALAMDYNSTSHEFGVKAWTDLLVDVQVPYPRAVVEDPFANAVYVVSMTSDETLSDNINVDDYPNWTHKNKHGDIFDMTVQRLDFKASPGATNFEGILDGTANLSAPPTSSATARTLSPTWTKRFPVDLSDDNLKRTVLVASMIYKAGTGLIITGSTAAPGTGYGSSEGIDQDGFITVLDPSTGELVQDSKSSHRFGTADYDSITGMCDDPADPKSFYVVGSTKGSLELGGTRTNDLPTTEGSLHAFIAKVNTDTLHREWTVQHGASRGNLVTEASALSCIATNGVVYAGGIVTDSAGMIDGQRVLESSGGDDIWVAQYDKVTADVIWMQQAGSTGDDHMARATGLVADAEGNAFVFGDTTGPLLRPRTVDTNTDLFGLSFSVIDGSFPQTVEGDVAQEPVTSTDDATNGDFAANPGMVLDAVLPPSVQVHQSGPNPGALYASQIIYDAETNEAIITGISYTEYNGRTSTEPNCVFARISLENMQTNLANIIGEPTVLETCRAMALANLGDSKELFVVGNSDPGGFYADGANVQAGFGMLLALETLDETMGDSLFANDEIPYPQAVVVKDNFAYVASMTTKENTENYSISDNQEYPNWTFLNRHGSIFELSVEKINLPTLESVWKKNFPVDAEADGSKDTVYVGGMIMKNDGEFLVAVGSTRAQGEAYGASAGDDEDGFIALLDPETGGLLPDRKNNERIGSYTDDVITAVCDVPSDNNAVVVVGATKGDLGGIPEGSLPVEDGSLQWFAKKIDLTTLKEVWTIQGGAQLPEGNGVTAAYALGCHVVADDTVYVAGTVQNGAGMIVADSAKASSGGDDVWTAKINLSDGAMQWMTQFGSSGDEHLSRGVGITADQTGNAILYGDTTGALYRSRAVDTNSDLFVAVLDSTTGAFGIKADPATPVESTPLAPTAPTPAPTKPPVQQGGTTAEGDAIPDDIVAIQLGPDVGPSYAGGMTYVSDTNSIYMTGSTWGTFSGPGIRPKSASSCFFARIDLPDLEVIQRDTYGVDTSSEACSAIVNHKYGGVQNAILLGSTEYGGILTDLTKDRRWQYGFAMDLTQRSKFEFLGGSLVGDTELSYPVALVTDDENFWVVSMTSDRGGINPDYEKVEDKKYPNFTSGGVKHFGQKYDISMERFRISRTGDGDPFAQGSVQTFESVWHKDLQTATSESIFMSGMAELYDSIVVVGSTERNGNMDGIIAKVDAYTGEFFENQEPGSVPVTFFDSVDNKNDWIMNVCSSPQDVKYFYIVGATQGLVEQSEGRETSDVTVHAFVSRINAVNLSVDWSQQFEVNHAHGGNSKAAAASALGCDILATENVVYIAGTVENGAVLVGADVEESAGRDDIFVAQLSTFDGTVNWLKQVGSNGDDRVARAEGIKVDRNGNAVVYGDTTGDFFRMRTPEEGRYSEPFVMVFDKIYGIHQTPLVGPVLKDAKKSGSNGATPGEFFSNLSSDSDGANGVVIVAILAVVALVVGGGYEWYRRQKRQEQREKAIILASSDLSLQEGSKSRGLFREGPSFGYSDDPLAELDNATRNGGSAGLVAGNFHKSYSDLPENGKEII